MKTNIVVYRDELLAASETFIRSQAEALREFRPFYVGVRAVAGLQLPAERCQFLVEPGPARWARRSFYKVFGPSGQQAARVRALSPALIHAHFGPDATHAQPLARALGVPLMVTHHGYDVTTDDQALAASAGLRRYLRRRAGLYESAALVLCVSNFVREKAIRRGAPAERTLVHYLGVDTSWFTPDPAIARSETVLFVGRLVENKGCELLLRAMALVKRSRPECRVVILGDGPLRPRLGAIARELALGNVSFLSTQPADAVRRWMNEARILCVPSVTVKSGASEGFGMVFAEAQAMGLPVASFETGGIPEAVGHGTTGLLAAERDVPGLARNIIALLSAGSMWQRFSDAARRRVRERFDLRRQTAALENIYRAVLQRETVPA